MASTITYPFDPRQIPFVGDQLGKLGHIYDIMSTPCDVEPAIWVKAAFHASPYLLLSLTAPECIDIDMPRAGRRHKRLRRLGFKWTQILQPTLVIRGMPSLVRFGFNMAERIGWHMLVVDATLDFAVNWTSMAYQLTGCSTSGMPYAWVGRAVGTYKHGEWVTPIWTSVHQSGSGMYANSHGIFTDPGVNVQMEYWGQTGLDDQWPGTYHTNAVHWQLIYSPTGAVIDERIDEMDQYGKLNIGGFLQQNPFMAPGGRYHLRYMATGPTTYGRMRNLRLRAMGRSTKGLVPSIPDCLKWVRPFI